ncbi:hypothetical protein BKA70DRAFT_1236619 [Coprinopsis sp. MPI-PUGE-AT-0042]|nr:hypothetical protein BKA70DRAFT_1236619 [Coprinopsis sp. MPI-PUGE-AT-0042]
MFTSMDFKQAHNQYHKSESSHHRNHRSSTAKQGAPCTVLPPFASLVAHSLLPSYPSPSVPTRQTATSLGPPLLHPFSYPGPSHAYQLLAPLMLIEVVVNVDLVYGDSWPVVEYSKIAQISLQPGERRFALDMKVCMDEAHVPFMSKSPLLHPQLLDDQHCISFALRHDPQPTVPRAVLPSTSTIDAGSLHSSAPVRHTIASPGLPLQSPFSYPGPPYAYQPLLSTFDGTVPMGGQEETGMVLEVVVNVDLVHGDPGPVTSVTLDRGGLRLVNSRLSTGPEALLSTCLGWPYGLPILSIPFALPLGNPCYPQCLGSNTDGLSRPKYIAITAGLDSAWTVHGQLCFNT